MGRLSVEAVKNRGRPVFKVYSLSFASFHDKVDELEGEGSVELEDGFYKVKGLDKGRPYSKVVRVNGDTDLELDFSNRYRFNVRSVTHIVAAAALIALVLSAALIYAYSRGLVL